MGRGMEVPGDLGGEKLIQVYYLVLERAYGAMARERMDKQEALKVEVKVLTN